MRGYRGAMVSRAVLIAMAMMVPAGAMAQTSGDAPRISVAIPAQGLSDALRQLAEASGLQLVYDTRITDGRTSPGVSGTLSAREALAAVLAGSGLGFQFSGDRTAVITASAGSSADGAGDGVRAVGVVSVEGAGGNMMFGGLVSPVNGVNGSRDVEATEGTGSYTTGAASIASKTPQTLRETPQSVTVMTAQRIADQALVSVRDILEKTTGVTVVNGGNNEEFTITSRGFNVTTFTLDGGAPVSFNYNNRPVIDFAQYDSVQLIRGANGTFAGYNDPGGTVNLVRKKPLDHKQFMFEQDVGSFANFRSEVDFTGPITADGKLRGRVVASRIDKEYFFDIAEAHKSSIYGILEYDLSPATLVTFGASHVRENNVPNQGGLPRYSDGTTIDFPRSTCLCVPIGYEHPRRTEVFGAVEQQIGKNVFAKLNATYSKQSVSALYLNSSSTVERNGPATGSLGGYATDNPLRQLSLDFFTSGNFNLLGRRVELTVGGNYQHIDASGGQVTGYDSVPIPDIFNFDPYAYQPAPQSEPTQRTLVNSAEQYGIYASVKVELVKNLFLSSAWRYNSFSDKAEFKFSYSPDPVIQPSLKQNNLSRPNIGVTFNFLDNFTLYGSYQVTYQPQQNTRFTTEAISTPPVTGVNKEAGLKWQAPGGKLNASLSLYSITQNNFLTTDFDQPERNKSALQDISSRGIDFELNGEIAKGWQVSIGYSYNKNKITKDGVREAQSSYTPKHILKTWTTYRAPQGAALRGLILGGGANLQSSSFNAGFLCVDPPTCMMYVPYAFTTKGYTTFALKVGYQLSRNIEFSLNAENVTDVNTYASNPFQGLSGYNSYIQPRTFTGSLRMIW